MTPSNPSPASSNEPDMQDVARKAVEWLSSPEGLEAMRVSKEKTDAFIAELRKCNDISHETLHRPFTI
jgi:hypothetical protein